MLWIFSVMALLVGLAALFFSGTTLNKVNTLNTVLTNSFKGEIKALKAATEGKTSQLDDRLSDLEDNVSPLARSHSNATAEVTAIRKEVMKLRSDLDRLDRSIPAQFRISDPDQEKNRAG